MVLPLEPFDTFVVTYSGIHQLRSSIQSQSEYYNIETWASGARNVKY